MADEKVFRLEIISPDRIFYQGDVKMVELATTEGRIGVYAQHVPTTSIVEPCAMSIHEADRVKKAAIHSGFIEILKNKVTILAEIAEWPEEIDINRANEAKIRAERLLGSSDPNVNILRAEAALKRSMARLDAVE